MTSLFRAALAAVLALLIGGPAPAAHAMRDVVLPGGGDWTFLQPSADSLIIYVSSSAGNDGNSGLSPADPKKTISAAKELLRDGFPDWLVLKCGDVWFESFGQLELSGRSEFEPMVFASYDEGDRPLLLTGTSTGMFMNAPRLDSVAVIGLSFRAHKWFGAGIEQPAGIFVLGDGDHLLIEGCKFENFAVNVSIQGVGSGRRDVRLRRNIMLDPLRCNPNGGSVNAFVTGYSGGLMIENNLFAMTDAVAARGSFLSHNLYLTDGQATDSIVRENIAYNAGRANLTVRSGGTVERNLSIGGALGIAIGYNLGNVAAGGSIRDNVVTRSRDNSNGQPLGVAFFIAKVTNAQFSNNIVTGTTRGGNPLAFFMQEYDDGIEIFNNIVWNWSRADASQPNSVVQIVPPISGPVSIYANQFQQVHPATLINVGTIQPGLNTIWLSANRYYAGGDTSTWFLASGQLISPAAWPQTSGEWNATYTPITYFDPNRDVLVYNTSLGGQPTMDAFIKECAKQSKSNWRPEYTAGSIVQFIRTGFAEFGSTACRADVDRDGVLTTRDRDIFFQLYRAGEPAADLNRDGSIGAGDLAVFWSSYGSNCASQ